MKKPKKTRDQIHDELLERLVVAQEKQTAFYERWDEQLKPLMKMIETTIKKQTLF